MIAYLCVLHICWKVIVSDTASERHMAEEVTDIPIWMYENSVHDRLTTSQLGGVYRSNRVLSVR